MAYTVVNDILVRLTSCYSCGTPIALTDNLERKLRTTHETFWCPLGHDQYFRGETDAERLKKELNAAQSRLTALETAKKNVEAELTVATRKLREQKDKVLAGLCPLCGKHVAHLERHIQARHKNLQETKA